MKKLTKKFNKGLVAGSSAATAALVSAQAHAEVPPSVTDGIATAITDIGVIGAAILGVVVAIAAFFWLRKPVK